MPHDILNVRKDDCRDAAYIARPSPLGNPYAMGLDGDREEVVRRYRDWLSARIAEMDPVVCTALLGIRPDQPLSCFCAPARCHGEVIAEFLDAGAQERLRKRDGKTLRYAGIGSRGTPIDVRQIMRKVARRLADMVYTLLSGGADGADSAFEEGSGLKEIYLPWPGFRDRQGPSCIDRPTDEARRVAAVVHPAWSRLSGSAQSLLARNSHQILGGNLRLPVDFVVCWTPDGCETESARSRSTGGTGQAIALADRWGVPVVNLANGKAALQRLAEIVC